MFFFCFGKRRVKIQLSVLCNVVKLQKSSKFFSFSAESDQLAVELAECSSLLSNDLSFPHFEVTAFVSFTFFFLMGACL